jgi:hypothetical protein
MVMLTIKASAKNATNQDTSNGIRSSWAKQIIKFHMMAAGSDIKSAAVAQTPIDTGNLRRSHGYAFDADAMKLFVFNRSKYAVFVHEGRKPGKMPPIAALIPWCRRHIVNTRIANAIGNQAASGVSPKGSMRKSASKDELSQAKSMAFLVARAIARRGTKPQPWFQNVVQSMGLGRIQVAGEKIGADFGNALIKAIAGRLLKRIGGET